ncbi:MAG: retropepsin-like aspartic protease [Bacteroidales bacterium]|nr:retropepsin-like aspartic protease [Bacteroidales bacterium]
MIFLTSCERKSGRKNGLRNPNKGQYENNRQSPNNSSAKTRIKMENQNGVKYVWIEINGLRLKFIFDTGASNICISVAEATVLYRQGTLKKEDILNVQYFQDATGNISEGTLINLRTVKVGERILKNIEAIVIDNDSAPLLLGQSALEKFGKISIDNRNNEIIFE